MPELIKENGCPKDHKWCPVRKKCVPEGQQKDINKEEKEMDDKALIQEISADTILKGGVIALGAAAIANRIAYCKEKYKGDSKKIKTCVVWYVKKEKDKKKDKKQSEMAQLVDMVFDEPGKFKQEVAANKADDLVDVILDNCGKDHSIEEVDNKIENAPTEDPAEDEKRVKADIAGEGGEEEPESAIEGAANVIDNMLKLNEATAYQKYFQAKLKSMGVNSPAELPADKKKAFFNAVDKGWKAKKESD